MPVERSIAPYEFKADVWSFETVAESGEGMAMKIRLERDLFSVL